MIEGLKQELWRRWGTGIIPAEWDGAMYGGKKAGGGKCSQRFWEYLWLLDQLSGNESKVLDVGSGSHLFLPKLLRTQLAYVEAVDPYVLSDDLMDRKMDIASWLGQPDVVPSQYDCVTCISVLEHVLDQPAFCSDLDKLSSAKIIMTMELGQEPPLWNYQLTMKRLYASLDMFKTHYVTKMEMCPIWADNSSGGYWRPFGLVLFPNKG